MLRMDPFQVALPSSSDEVVALLAERMPDPRGE